MKKDKFIKIINDLDIDGINGVEVFKFINEQYQDLLEELEPEDLEEGDLYGEPTLDITGQEPYTIQIMDYDRVENAQEEALYNYIDDCILPEIPEFVKTYFDYDKWINDAKMDGIHHTLSGYDGGGEEGETLISFHN